MTDHPPPNKLIVVLAFNRGDDGELHPAFDPREMQNEGAAIRLAKMIEDQHAGVIAWWRAVEPNVGEYGPPTVLYQSGEIPEME